MSLTRVWRILVGEPLPTAHAMHTRLPKWMALPVFASDALSSTAYATQEVVIPLVLAGGIAALSSATPVSIAIGALLCVVAVSYMQTIRSYPRGASCYLVSKDNLGTTASLVAGAGLLTGYILTVAVSIASGVEQLTSAFQNLEPYAIHLSVITVAAMTVVNLRGAKESGAIFAIPTYFFIACMYVLILSGLYKAHVSGAAFHPLPPPQGMEHLLGGHSATLGLGAILLLRAFSHGCTALTGIEAISDGVGAFRAPEWKNASVTLAIMAGLLTTLFLGISYLAQIYNAVPVLEGTNPHNIKVTDSLLSVLAGAVWGKGTWAYYAATTATTTILFLGANTAFADFPRLSSFLAADRFMPSQFTNLGDRLVFSNGILFLGAFSAFLLILFKGNTHLLLPLYAIGVFLSFTLSQTSMVVHWLGTRRPGWRVGIVLNGFGAICTTIVFLVLAYFRFFEGAWIVMVLIPAQMVVFLVIRGHYDSVKKQLHLGEEMPPAARHTTVLVMVPNLGTGVVHALQYAQMLSKDVRGVHIDLSDGEKTAELKTEWDRLMPDVPLVILPSPYRSLVEPTLEYVEEVKGDRSNFVVTVVVPEYVPTKWWHAALHNQSALALKIALLFRRDIVVTNVRYWLK